MILATARLARVSGLFAPVRIAGASMAETLRGAHYRLRCADCRFPFRYDAERPPSSGRTVCPNCGYVEHDLSKATLQPGQRVLIDRWAYRCRSPRRWDLIAVRVPHDPDYFEVKRVVGLPGERISIRQGDIYADGRIVRKTLRELRRMAVLVHDSAFEPHPAGGLPSRWQALTLPSWTNDGPNQRISAGQTAVAGQDESDSKEPCDAQRQGWQIVPGGGFRRPRTAACESEANWLVYQHWRCFASPLARTDASYVLDNYGYNQNESRQLHRVRDLMFVCHLRTGSELGTFQLRMSDGEDWFQADLELASRQVILYRNDQRLSVMPLPDAAYAREVKLEFALCDRQVLLAVDEQTVACWPYEAAVGGRAGLEVPDRWQSRPVGIAADGMSIEIRRLQVFRDLYYLDPHGLGRDWTAPARLDSGQVLVLGDNVPVSRDSRQAPRAGVPRDLWLGRVMTLR